MSPSLSAKDLFTVQGLVAVVTGGATGIGLMIAKALEENGAKVFIVGRRKDVLESVAKKEAKYGNLIPIVGDVTSKVDLEQITKRISSEVGHINLLVANAGTTGPMFGDRISICGPDQSPLSDVQKDLWNIDQDAFLNTFKTNIGGPFWSIVAFLPLLDAGNRKGNVVQSSHVVATGSEAAYDRIPIPHYTYSASKAGLTHMMKQFATTFVKYKIRFNVIAPGLYPSELTAGFIASTENLSGDEKASLVSPLQRPGNMEDMAGVALWLASRAGAWVHGNVVLTDGGKISSVPATY